jgi:hypothetical protein
MAALITNPWLTLSGVGTVYLAIMPFGWYKFWRQQQTEAQQKLDV